ncbi:MAG TPA: methyltransferase domain-containing protein, partial [Gammaproteobacteria bacterium]
ERWPGAEVRGIDSSAEMLDRAAAGGGDIRWVRASAEEWRPDAPPDLIYSNAALHWVADHGRHFPRLLSYLRPGGCLAVQMPLSWGEPSHRLMRETLAGGGAGGRPLGTQALRDAVARKWVEDPADYYDLLSAGSARLDIWKTEYLQVLDGDDPVFEWVRGTGLRPVLNGLEGHELTQFVPEYKRRLREAYPRRSDGKTLYPFPRLFMVAVAG